MPNRKSPIRMTIKHTADFCRLFQTRFGSQNPTASQKSCRQTLCTVNYELLRDGNCNRSSKRQHSNRSYTKRHKAINWGASTGEFLFRIKLFLNLGVILVNGNQCFEVKAVKVNAKYKFRSLFYKHINMH
jgi:hypothetical protein